MLLSVPEAMEDMMAMKRLWVHEVLRVYYDRLVDDNDRCWIIEALRDICQDKLEESIDVMFQRLASPDNPKVNIPYSGRYDPNKCIINTSILTFRL